MNEKVKPSGLWWILCTDCTDGQRMAFPAASTAISYDMREHKRHTRELMQQAEGLQPNPMAVAAALGQRESLESITARSEDEKVKLISRYKRILSAEAVLLFGARAEGVIAVRGLHFTDSWEAVEMYTNEANTLKEEP